MTSSKKKDIETPGQMIRYLRMKKPLTLRDLLRQYNKVMEERGEHHNIRGLRWIQGVEYDNFSEISKNELDTLFEILNHPEQTTTFNINHWFVKNKELSKAKNTHTPPTLAENILKCLLPQENQSDTLGDLEEEFREKYAQSGYKKAAWWYRWQVLKTLWFFLWRIGRNVVQRIK